MDILCFVLIFIAIVLVLIASFYEYEHRNEDNPYDELADWDEDGIPINKRKD